MLPRTVANTLVYLSAFFAAIHIVQLVKYVNNKSASRSSGDVMPAQVGLPKFGRKMAGPTHGISFNTTAPITSDYYSYVFDRKVNDKVMCDPQSQDEINKETFRQVFSKYLFRVTGSLMHGINVVLIIHFLWIFLVRVFMTGEFVSPFDIDGDEDDLEDEETEVIEVALRFLEPQVEEEVQVDPVLIVVGLDG